MTLKTNLVGDDVDEAAWNDDYFSDLFSIEEGDDLFIGEGGSLH